MVFLVLFGLPARADTGAAARYSAAHGERALLVWQNGRLRMERYGAGASRDKIENVYSITKSLCALGTFTAIGHNLLKLDESASLTLTEWRSDPRKSRITVRDLLNQTSGLSAGVFPNLFGKSPQQRKGCLGSSHRFPSRGGICLWPIAL